MLYQKSLIAHIQCSIVSQSSIAARVLFKVFLRGYTMTFCLVDGIQNASYVRRNVKRPSRTTS